MLQLWREIRDFLQCEFGITPITGPGHPEVLFVVRNSAPRGEDYPAVVFRQVVLHVGVNGKWNDISCPDLASGETFRHSMQCRYEDLAGLQWNLDASIDSEAFARVTRQPQSVNLRKGVLPMQAYFYVLEAARIHRWRDDVLTAVRNAEPSATLGSLRQQQEELWAHMGEIRATADRLQRTLGFLTTSEVQRIVQFHHSVAEYLQQTEAALAEVAEALLKQPARAGDRAKRLVARLGEVGRQLERTGSEPTAGGASAPTSPANPTSSAPTRIAESDAGGGSSMGLHDGRSPNDDRSDTMNPNNPAHQAATDNRSNQMNPNNPAYHSSRGHR